MSEKELLPCPFCGNRAVSEVVRPHFGKGTIAIECNACKTRGPETRYESFNDKYTAQHRTAWNTRPDSKTGQDCKSFCKLFSEAKLQDDFYLEKCRLCKESPNSKPSPIAAVLEKISRVAHGEDQVGDDDTEGMAWIAEFVDKHRGLLADSKPYKYGNPEQAWGNEDDPINLLEWDSYRDGFNAARERKEG